FGRQTRLRLYKGEGREASNAEKKVGRDGRRALVPPRHRRERRITFSVAILWIPRSVPGGSRLAPVCVFNDLAACVRKRSVRKSGRLSSAGDGGVLHQPADDLDLRGQRAVDGAAVGDLEQAEGLVFRPRPGRLHPALL